MQTLAQGDYGPVALWFPRGDHRNSRIVRWHSQLSNATKGCQENLCLTHCLYQENNPHFKNDSVATKSADNEMGVGHVVFQKHKSDKIKNISTLFRNINHRKCHYCGSFMESFNICLLSLVTNGL